MRSAARHQLGLPGDRAADPRAVPDLCDHVLPLLSPMETAATIAKQRAKENRPAGGKIGCFFITPCPAKVTDIRMPIGIERSKVDGAIAISEIFPQLSKPHG